MDADFLVLRAQDHVLLGLRWTGMAVVGSAPPTIEAVSDQSTVMLGFPPQHLGEQISAPGSDPQLVNGLRVYFARLAGPSQIAFRLPPGQRLVLTVEGLLAGLNAAPPASGTALEMPYRVTFAPSAGAGFTHRSDPLSSPGGTVGLWRTRLTAAGPMPVTPVDIDTAADPFPLALTRDNRISILNGGSPLPASARRLELSSLGGSIDLNAASPGFEWQHHVAVGRDVHVRTVTHVRLYPFNHRAAFIEVSDRVFDAVGPDQAALKKDSRLVVLEPFVDLPLDGPLGRQFPFSRVEILDAVLPQVTGPNWVHFFRTSLTLAALRQDRDSTQASRDANMAAIAGQLAEPLSFDELLSAGFGPAVRLSEINAALLQIDTDLGPAQEALDAANRAADEIGELQDQIDDLQSTPVGPDGFLDPSIQQQISELSAQITQLQPTAAGGNPQFVASLTAKAAALEREAAPLRQQVDTASANGHSVADLAAAGVAEAIEVERLDEVLAGLNTQIAEQEAGERVPTNWYFVPSDSAGTPVPFSLRMTGATGDLTLTMPLIAVNDEELPESPGFAPFSTATDPKTAEEVGKRWAGAKAGAVAMPPTPVAMVRASQPRPGDILELQGFDVGGVLDGGRFRPLLNSFTVGLPEVRTLLGEAKTMTVGYTPEFLRDGEVQDLAFELLDKTIPVDLSFVKQADKSGGLVSPRMLADGISREFGPVAVDGVRNLIGDKFDAARLLADGATILGFDLRDLVKEIDAPPAIISDLIAGTVPVVRMQWRNIELHSAGPFVATAGAVLDLDVESAPNRTVTTCTLRNIALSLPTPDTELLRLTFGSITFIQEPGRSPKLDVSGLDLEFNGKLRLLQVLQQAVGLGDTGALVDASPTGVVARYSLPIPEVSTGSFVMRNILFRAGIDVPFTGDPVVVTIGFATREAPFNLSVLALGGGGYVELQLDHSGLRSIEAALEFGATIAIDFLVAAAEVHAMGGIRFAMLPDKSVELAGYIRIGGSVDVLGLVSVSVELLVELRYEQDSNEMVGRATLVVDIDLTLYSHKVELDSGRWAVSGGVLPLSIAATERHAEPFSEDDSRAAWEQYRKAFAS